MIKFKKILKVYTILQNLKTQTGTTEQGCWGGGRVLPQYFWNYLTISHQRRREYWRIVTEMKLSTEPELTNCFSIIALMIIQENINKNSKLFKNILFFILKKHESKHACTRHCYNHLAVIIATENEVLNQSAHTIFDNHQCNFTKKI